MKLTKKILSLLLTGILLSHLTVPIQAEEITDVTNVNQVQEIAGVDTTKKRNYMAKQISLKGTAKREAISFYYNQKGQMRYVVSSIRGTYIYKRINGKMVPDKKDPYHKFTRRKNRTRPYDGYTSPIWDAKGKTWYAVHFSSIYQCNNKGTLLKRFNVMQKLGLDGNRCWIWDICKLKNYLWALEIHDAKKSTSRIYIVDFKKEKIIKKLNKQYSYIHGTAGNYLYASKFVEGKGHTRLAKINLKDYKTVDVISTAPIRKMQENPNVELEFISTVYKNKLYLRHPTGIYSWNEKKKQFDQLVDGSHPSIGNMEYGYFRFLSPTKIYSTGYAIEGEKEDYNGSLYQIDLQ